MQILTTQAAEKLLRQPGVKVIRNPLPLHWVRLVGAMYLTLLWLGLLVMIIVGALETHDLWRSYWVLGIIMLVHVATCVSIFIAGRRAVLALNKEGMYLSKVDSEDFRGPMTLRRRFFRWDELTELKLTSGPVLSFRVKGHPYGFAMNPIQSVNIGGFNKRNMQLVEAITAYSGYPHHIHNDGRNYWQCVFATSLRPANAEADVWDWDSLQPVTP